MKRLEDKEKEFQEDKKEFGFLVKNLQILLKFRPRRLLHKLKNHQHNGHKGGHEDYSKNDGNNDFLSD